MREGRGRGEGGVVLEVIRQLKFSIFGQVGGG